ncbi:mannose-6-phosphate isomerase, type I [Actinidia rufa]|uniref:Mannose-6-phosphate isomerase, type I n=1 Tax=Actinidia rufa TaxID=165716 RepID=A0A7J0FY95_9ERIC|nr:mannose-6-phosphate isomerase, type I [Actinidia rufa]
MADEVSLRSFCYRPSFTTEIRQIYILSFEIFYFGGINGDVEAMDHWWNQHVLFGKARAPAYWSSVNNYSSSICCPQSFSCREQKFKKLVIDSGATEDFERPFKPHRKSDEHVNLRGGQCNSPFSKISLSHNEEARIEARTEPKTSPLSLSKLDLPPSPPSSQPPPATSSTPPPVAPAVDPSSPATLAPSISSGEDLTSHPTSPSSLSLSLSTRKRVPYAKTITELKDVLQNVLEIAEVVGHSAYANQILDINYQDGEEKLKAFIQSIFTQLMYASKDVSSMLTYKQGFPEILQGYPLNPYTKRYIPPFDEFEVDRCILPQGDIN